MDLSDALAPFESLRVWSRGAQRAPHKPLLALYALGRLSRGDAGPLLFEEVEADLAALLEEFGPARSRYHTEYPFWRLQTDGVWEVAADDQLMLRAGNTDPLKSELIAHRARGGFTASVREAFAADGARIAGVAQALLEAHFPETIHVDVLAAVGLDLDMVAGGRLRRPRDPGFRPRILAAYEDRCAVCDYDLRLGPRPIGLDAAHIKWHQAGGPDHETNGLALCTLHHKVFDLGAFTVAPDQTVQVSSEVRGPLRLDEVLLRHHGQPIRAPLFPEQAPAPEHLEWHRAEVFRGRERVG